MSDKKSEILRLIEKLFADTSVSPDVTEEALSEIAERAEELAQVLREERNGE